MPYYEYTEINRNCFHSLIFRKEKVEPGPEAEDTSCAVSDPELEGEVKERLP